MATRIHADPYLAPCRRDRELDDALERLGIVDPPAIGIAVFEAAPAAAPCDSRRSAVRSSQSRHLHSRYPLPVGLPLLARSTKLALSDFHEEREPTVADFTVKRIDEMEAIYGGAFKRARAELGVESFGMQVIEMPPGSELYPEHDHAGDGQEEVYVVLS